MMADTLLLARTGQGCSSAAGGKVSVSVRSSGTRSVTRSLVRPWNAAWTTQVPVASNTTRRGTEPITVPARNDDPLGLWSTTRLTGGRLAGATRTSTT